jgi:putative flippase GtrA
MTLFFGTIIQEISLVGFESTSKEDRDTYLIILSVGRSIGVLVLCCLYYFLQDWLYVESILLAMLIVHVSLFIKFVYESPHYILATSANVD